MMTQENKELLFKDLCERFPYDTKYALDGFIIEKFKNGKLDNNVWDVISFNKDTESIYYELCHIKHTCPNETIYHNYVHFSRFKPYLFPLSSMSKKQKKYISDRWGINDDFDFEIDPNWGEYFVDLGDAVDFIDWLNANHFDFRGLIPKGLALDATGKKIY